jgi:hypothetical protein
MTVSNQANNVGEACIHNLPAIFDVRTRRAPTREGLQEALDACFAMFPRPMERMLNLCPWKAFGAGAIHNFEAKSKVTWATAPDTISGIVNSHKNTTCNMATKDAHNRSPRLGT